MASPLLISDNQMRPEVCEALFIPLLIELEAGKRLRRLFVGVRYCENRFSTKFDSRFSSSGNGAGDRCQPRCCPLVGPLAWYNLDIPPLSTERFVKRHGGLSEANEAISPLFGLFLQGYVGRLSDIHGRTG